MNEWKKVSEELPPLEMPVWAGWFFTDGRFASGLFAFCGDGCGDASWCLCEDRMSDDNFIDYRGEFISEEYPVSHWMYLPAIPENQE
mgnify:FL=1|jgi:hypothetical protein